MRFNVRLGVPKRERNNKKYVQKRGEKSTNEREGGRV